MTHTGTITHKGIEMEFVAEYYETEGDYHTPDYSELSIKSLKAGMIDITGAEMFRGEKLDFQHIEELIVNNIKE